MNVVLNASELIHLLELAIKHPMMNSLDQENILRRLKSPLEEILEKVEVKTTLNKYRDWVRNESDKIDALKQKNSDIRSSNLRSVSSNTSMGKHGCSKCSHGKEDYHY